MSKKLSFALLLLSTALFACLLIGVFIGRSTAGSQINLSQYEKLSATGSTDAVSDISESAGKINLNTATIDDLTLLPGIGEVLAQRIIAYRDEIGGYKNIDELINVQGIGNATLNKISDYITVGG